MPVPEGVSAEKYDSCVDQIKAKGDKTKNPYAVCAASLKKEDEVIKFYDNGQWKLDKTCSSKKDS